MLLTHSVCSVTQAAAKRQKADCAEPVKAMPDMAELPAHASRLTVSKRGSGIFQVASVVHAVALDCGLQAVYHPEAQVGLV